MERRNNLLAYLALGLGVAALVIGLGGRMERRGSLPTNRDGHAGRNVPQAAAPQTPPVQVAPNPGQGQVEPRRGMDRRDDDDFGGFGFAGDRGRFDGGAGKLIGGLLIAGLGLFLLRSRIGHGPRRGGFGRGHRERYEAAWQPVSPTPAPPPAQANPPAAPPPQASQTPPTPPAYTGETTRFYDF